MKRRHSILAVLVVLSAEVFGQMTIGKGVSLQFSSGASIATSSDVNFESVQRNLGESSWYLVGVNQQLLGSAVSTVFNKLFVRGGGVKTFSGNFQVSNQLHLNDGVISIPTNQEFTLSTPSVVQPGHGVLSYVDGMLRINIGDNSSAIYPIGNNGVYAPIELTTISGSNPIIGVDANNESIGTFTELPELVNNYSTKWNWELALFTSDDTFTDANITIPLTDEDKVLFAGDDYQPLVLYKGESVDAIRNLGNSSEIASNNDALITAKDPAGKGKYFAGKTLVFNPVIHNIITPNGDNTNDYLVIENLQFFPEHEIIIVDRYGLEIYSKTNYTSPSADSSEGEDFTFLSAGNYICILKFNKGENTLKQTISVIK